jgi:predicted DsbA family dithiol-disulfide isomerase
VRAGAPRLIVLDRVDVIDRCFVGKRNLEAAIREFKSTSPAVEFRVDWKPFFLREDLPEAGVTFQVRYVTLWAYAEGEALPQEYIRRNYGDRFDIDASQKRLAAYGKEVGARAHAVPPRRCPEPRRDSARVAGGHQLRVPPRAPPCAHHEVASPRRTGQNEGPAGTACHGARSSGPGRGENRHFTSRTQDPVMERIFHRYFEKGQMMNSNELLLGAAKDVGMNEEVPCAAVLRRACRTLTERRTASRKCASSLPPTHSSPRSSTRRGVGRSPSVACRTS